jgi:hypothetical protein
MEIINAYPFLERSNASIWNRVVEAQNRTYELFSESCIEKGLRSLLIKSNPSEYPVRVEMQLWTPYKEKNFTARNRILMCQHIFGHTVKQH